MIKTLFLWHGILGQKQYFGYMGLSALVSIAVLVFEMTVLVKVLGASSVGFFLLVGLYLVCVTTVKRLRDAGISPAWVFLFPLGLASIIIHNSLGMRNGNLSTLFFLPLALAPWIILGIAFFKGSKNRGGKNK